MIKKHIKPVTIEEVENVKQTNFDEVSIKVINQLIVNKWNGHQSNILHEDIINNIIENRKIKNIYSKYEISNYININFLDKIYGKYGWFVGIKSYNLKNKVLYIFKKSTL